MVFSELVGFIFCLFESESLNSAQCVTWRGFIICAKLVTVQTNQAYKIGKNDVCVTIWHGSAALVMNACYVLSGLQIYMGAIFLTRKLKSWLCFSVKHLIVIDLKKITRLFRQGKYQ